jgi:DNA-binding LacI/PurR family transcriptional regulator
MTAMLNRELHLTRVHALADRLISDIRHRGLAVGDRYLTADEVGRMLGVRKATAGKAIRQLAEREILIPRQRAGTFVGPGLKKDKRSQVRTLYVLLPAGDLVASRWSYEPFIAGIRSEFPEVNVQFTFVPENDPLPYVQELIDSSRAAGQFAGVVSVSCPPEVYRYLAELRVPAVVFGSLYSAELDIVSVDVDNVRSGRILTQYVLDRGHRRVALLLTGAGRPGNNLFLDGVSDALTAAGLTPNALIQRLIHNDIAAFRSVARELLQMSDRPTAVITRGSIQAEAVASVAAGSGLVVPDTLEIVFDDEDQIAPSVPMASFPCVRPELSFAKIAATIGKILKEMSEGILARTQRVVVPVELHEPQGSVQKIVD